MDSKKWNIRDECESIGLRTVRDFLVGAAAVGGSVSGHNPLMVFTRIQIAIDALDAGFGIDDNILDFVSMDEVGAALLRDYQRIVGEAYPVFDVQTAARAIGLR